MAQGGADALGDGFESITQASAEARGEDAARAARRKRRARRGTVPAGEALAKFSVDLTERARKGEIDRSSGATPRSARSSTCCCAAARTIPILTGEAGVGKTAVVEGFASASPTATCRPR
jgi:type VI secretion system protein VasG